MIKVFKVVFEVPDGDTELTADRILETFDANAHCSFPEGTSWTIYKDREIGSCKYRKDDDGRCIASDIVADYVVENQNLRRDLERAEEQVQMLKDGLQEYANRITDGEFERMKERFRCIRLVIEKAHAVLKNNKRDAKKMALGILEAYILYGR